MLAFRTLLVGLSALAAARFNSSQEQPQLIEDFDIIKRYLGQLSPYSDNADDVFGVKDVGLPDGCQVEQVHTLQRHAERFPTGAFDDGANNENFAAKVKNFTEANSGAQFTGPLHFLNSYRYDLNRGFLTGRGASAEFASGVSFYDRYGRILYNATVGQVQYNESYTNGTARPKPVLRTTGQSRIENSQISWSLGFFGPSFNEVSDPALTSFANGSLFGVVVIPEGGVENNTLASYDSCFRDLLNDVAYLGDRLMFSQYVPLYIENATARINQYAPAGFQFNNNDTYAMQSICAYEHAYIGMSDFCNLFTIEEWQGFEQALDIEYYYDYAWGNPTGRAQGLGYQQELLARLKNEYIASSNSSVNSTITSNPDDFPLGRPFYADFSHDDIIISALTSMSVDYFKDAPSLTQFPPDSDRHFVLSKMTPFGARLITEVVGCSKSDPTAVKSQRTYYYPTQYGYDAASATHKFVRMRLNNGIVPLDTIRGGKCQGRTDGLCAIEDFLSSQDEAMELANYDFACFANYTISNTSTGFDYDGTINNDTDGITINPGKITAEYISELFGY